MSEAEELAVGAAPVVGRVGLRAALVSGAAWTAGATATASLVSAGVGLALARLLTPADFGIQTAVVTITVFLGALLDTGLGSAVVQREDLDHDELSSVFWAGVGASVALYLLVVAATPLAVLLFNASALRAALPVAALSIIVIGGAIVPAALLRRELKFAAIARAQVAGAVTGAALAMVVAVAGGHYWALIAFTLASVVTSSALMCIAGAWRPARTMRIAHLSRVRGYAGSMMSFITVNYWSRNLDDLLIGRFLGIAPLGIFSLAQRLVGAPLQLLTGSLSPLLHPTFAAMGDDVPRQRAAYLDLVRVTALLTFPVSAMLFVLAEPLVLAIGGETWASSAPVMRALCLLAAIQPVNMLCGAVFMARDAAHLMLRCASVGAIAVVIGMLIGLRYGVSGVAWGYSLAYLLVAAPVSTLVAFRLIQGRPSQLGRALAMPALIGVGVLGMEAGLHALLAPVLAPNVAMAILLAVSVLVVALIAAPTAKRALGARRTRRVAA